MNDIVILGAGGLGKEVLELILQINKKGLTWNVLGFFDDTKEVGTEVNGIKVVGGLEELRDSACQNLVIAIGNPEVRAKLIREFSMQKTLPTLIHPTVMIPDSHISIGTGSIIGAHVFLSVNVSIGSGVLLNVGCSIGHDVAIGDYCTVNPGARVSGSVKIGELSFIGVGAVLNNNILIASEVKVGAGAVVLKSVEKKSTVFGNPARIMLNN
jgi:sugar O-acyltransferase (sialic acid O-acetyltransferase NeuD family)